MKNPKDQFFAKMKDPSAAKIANYIKRFLGGFCKILRKQRNKAMLFNNFARKFSTRWQYIRYGNPYRLRNLTQLLKP